MRKMKEEKKKLFLFVTPVLLEHEWTYCIPFLFRLVQFGQIIITQ